MPRWRVIRDELATVAATQAYGSSFLTIAEICQRYDVSNITARRVLHELQADGLVEKIRGRGTIVRGVTQNISVRLVVPSGVRSDYMTFSPIMRRLIAGVTGFTGQHQIDFDTTNEAHLETLFDRPRENFGLLLPAPVMRRQSIGFIRQRRLPHVFVLPLRRWKHSAVAAADRYQAGFLATQHLLSLGHRRIAYVLGAVCHLNFRERLRGYRDALQAAGIPFRWTLVHETDGLKVEQDEQAIDELLALRRPPTAVITGDDDYRAIHILNHLRRRGIRVPQQISLLGYPNCPDSRLTDPPLSVVDANYEEVGAAAMRLLLAQMLEGADPARQQVLIAPRVVERASTAPPPADTEA